MPIELSFSEEEQMLRDMVRNTATKEWAPKMREIDEEGKMPPEHMALAKELGLFGVGLPKEANDCGMGLVGLCIACEEMAKAGCSSQAELIGIHNAVARAILILGTADQRQKYLPKLATGEYLATYAFAEPESGSDLTSIRTKAVEKDGQFYLKGNKNWVTNASNANLILTLATVDRKKKAEGLALFIIEKPEDGKGLRIGIIERKLGTRASEVGELIFDDLAVPKTNLIGEVGKGSQVAEVVYENLKMVLSASALGTSKGALELASKQANTRIQFGKPIGVNQAIQWMLADMATNALASENLIYPTATRLEQLHSMRINGSEISSTFSERIQRDLAITKLFTSETAFTTMDQCVQVFGGMGYMRHSPIERMYRDSRLLRIAGGASELQKSAIAIDVLKKESF